eukprot:c14990_g1_i1 orf=3-383(+)
MAHRLNIRITGVKEGSSALIDAQDFCRSLGYTEMPFTKAWRAGKDDSKTRPLLIQMHTQEERTAFFRKRVMLRSRPGAPVFIDEDLTKMQIAHRRTCMPQILQAKKEGKKAFYRDGRVFIDGRPTK